MVTRFWPKCKKCSKMESNCQIFTSLRARITIFRDMKHTCITMYKKQEMGSIGALKLHPVTFKFKNVNFKNVKNFSARNSKCEI